MQTISDGVFVETSFPGVTLGAVILAGGTLLIDSPLRAEDSRSWKSMLLTQSRGTHRLLVNLDEHHDRTIGNRSMGLPIIAHTKILDMYENRPTVFKGQYDETGATWEEYPEVIGSRWIRPNITFDDQIQIHWDDEVVIVIQHHPGPTPGAAWVELPTKKIVFVGDAALENQPPFFAMANLEEWIETLSLLRTPKYRDYIFVSGRSGLIPIEAIRSQHEFLRSTLGRLETLANKTTDPIETEKLVPALLEKLNYPKKYQLSYAQRLQYGLFHYFQNHYCPSEQSEDD